MYNPEGYIPRLELESLAQSHAYTVVDCVLTLFGPFHVTFMAIFKVSHRPPKCSLLLPPVQRLINAAENCTILCYNHHGFERG
jgi:hypothetical protein